MIRLHSEIHRLLEGFLSTQLQVGLNILFYVKFTLQTLFIKYVALLKN